MMTVKYAGPRRPLGGHPAREKDESEVRWLISYSDFMMQLVCLFILLFSVSAMDKGKTQAIAQAWRQQVGIEPVPAEIGRASWRERAVGDRPVVPVDQGRADIPAGVRVEVGQVPGGRM